MSRAGWFLMLVGCLGSAVTARAGDDPAPAPVTKSLPLPGEVFAVEGHAAFVILPAPEARVPGQPWVLYAPTLPGLPGTEEVWMFERFLKAGVAVAGIDVGESYGSPEGRRLYQALYQELTGSRKFGPRPCLLARSRGGLMLYNWAVEHPRQVSGVAGIYPVCDLRSYPGLDKAAGAYGLTPEGLAEVLTRHNPVDRVEPLAKAGVPVLHIHGDQDTVGPPGGELRRPGPELPPVRGTGHPAGDRWPGAQHVERLVPVAGAGRLRDRTGPVEAMTRPAQASRPVACLRSRPVDR